MGSLTALILATPIFGLSLQVQGVAPTTDLAVSTLPAIQAAADLEVDGEAEGDGDVDAEPSYAELMKERNSLAELHRPLGIATWAAMSLTTVLGFVQYYNLYGFGAGIGDNPCVEGNAIFGQGQCSGTPYLHLSAAALTTALYSTTFALGSLMPDPDDLSEGPGEFASTLRMHKLLRWVHFGGMIAQIVLGTLAANPGLIGLNRAEDYGALQALGTVHLATGLVTYGALTWAGALMVF